MKKNELELLIDKLRFNEFDYNDYDNSVVIYLFAIDIECRLMSSGVFECKFYHYDSSAHRYCYRKAYNLSANNIIDMLDDIKEGRGV